MTNHQLAREIIATQISNFICVQMGVIFVQRLYDETGAIAAEIVKAFAAVSNIFDIVDVWRSVDELATKVSVSTHKEIMDGVLRFMRRICRWVLRHNRSGVDIQAVIDKYKEEVNATLGMSAKLIEQGELGVHSSLYNRYIEEGVPSELALKIVSMKATPQLMDIVTVAKQANVPELEMVQLFDILNKRLSLTWFRDSIAQLEKDSYWSTLSCSALRDDMDLFEAEIAAAVLKCHQGHTTEEKLESWMQKHDKLLARWEGMIIDMKAEKPRFVSINIAHRGLMDISQASRLCLI